MDMKFFDVFSAPRRAFGRLALGGLLLAGALALTPPVLAAQESPQQFVQRISADVLDTIKADKSIKSGDIDKIMRLVDSEIMPNVNFERMTSAAVGPSWRSATPEQRSQLQQQFKTLLVRTYAGALDQVSNQTVNMMPFRGSPDDSEVLVRTEVVGSGDPVQLDYRLEKSGDSWKIYNINVLGVWLVETYRTQFAQQINAKGIDGLIDALATRNKNNNKS